MSARNKQGNCHKSYKAKDYDQGTAIIAFFAHLVSVNKTVQLKPDKEEKHGVFGCEWTYEWASVEEYVERLEEWIACGPESFVVALALMKRLEELDVFPLINQRSFHRSYVTSLILAVKYMEDETLSNADFAKVACVTVDELNHMEMVAFQALDFNCTVTPEEFEAARGDLDSFVLAKKRNHKKLYVFEPLTVADAITDARKLAETKRIAGRIKKRASLTLVKRGSASEADVVAGAPLSFRSTTNQLSARSTAQSTHRSPSQMLTNRSKNSSRMTVRDNKENQGPKQGETKKDKGEAQQNSNKPSVSKRLSQALSRTTSKPQAVFFMTEDSS